MKPLNFSSLSSEVTKADTDAYAASIPNGELLAKFTPVAGIIGAILIGVFLLGTIPFVFLTITSLFPNGIGIFVGFIVGMAIFAGIILLVIKLAQYFIQNARQNVIDIIRLKRFVEANDMLFEKTIPAPGYKGILFAGHSDPGKSLNVLRTKDGKTEVANYEWTTGSGEDSHTYRWGYIRIKLERHVPEMILLAKHSVAGGNATTLVGLGLAKGQTVSLEGDFDKYFTLHVPKEYGVDARYIFTPDLMALLIDHVTSYDVQIVDDYVYIYSWIPFKLGEQAVVERLFAIIQTVGEKVVDTTDHYVDQRVVSALQADTTPEGVRLKRSKFGLSTVATLVLIILFSFIFIVSLISHS